MCAGNVERGLSMEVLIGTTNPSKITYYESKLKDYPVTFLTLKDLNIDSEPEETGSTPEENALIKARYYGQFFDTVICNDSGLYLDALPMDDPRQPGLNVRTPMGHARLSDEEMIAYYTALSKCLGGKALAYYLHGFAVYRKGKLSSYTEAREEKKETAFYLLDHEILPRHEGWPLDSISLRNENAAVHQADRKEVMAFLVRALEIA